jgi:hypothetical protein
MTVSAFIIRNWPIRIPVPQAKLNPGYAGMPPESLSRGMEVSTDLPGRNGPKER